MLIFLRSPLGGSKYQWIGMKLDEGIKLKKEKPVGNYDHNLTKLDEIVVMGMKKRNWI